MGGWKLEVSKMALYVLVPVGTFWVFNQPAIFEYMNAKFPSKIENKYDAEARNQFNEWKQYQIEAEKRADFEKYLREKMDAEEARRLQEAREKEDM